VERTKHDFLGAFTFEMADELEYTKMAYNEIMRINTPFAISGLMSTFDTVIMGGYEISPEMAIIVNTEAMHYDKD